jgi:hypothetical protein
MYQTEEIDGVEYRVDDEGNYFNMTTGKLVDPYDPSRTPTMKDTSWARGHNPYDRVYDTPSKSSTRTPSESIIMRPPGGWPNAGKGKGVSYDIDMGTIEQVGDNTVQNPITGNYWPPGGSNQNSEGDTLAENKEVVDPLIGWDGKPFEHRDYDLDISKRGLLGAIDEKGRRTHRGLFGGILKGADELFNDPRRMALIAGGLRMADPNSYYDKQGFYSPWGGINEGLGTGIKTYKELSEPKKLGFEAQEKIKHRNALALEDRKALGKDSFTAMFKNFKKAQEDGYEGTFYEYQVDLKKAGKTSVTVNTGEQKMTKGREASDKAVGQMYAEYIARGGYGDAMKNLSQLKVAEERLLAVSDGTSGDNLTGPLLGMVPDFIRSFYNPESIDTRELVEEVVQRNLKLILGAQFTEREGERLIARAYNPKLDEASNAKRLGRLVKAMEIAMEARNDSFTYFEDNGTLLGWKGRTPTMDDFMRAVGDAPTPTTPAEREPIPEGFEVVE